MHCTLSHLKELELHDLSNRVFCGEPTAHVRTGQEAPEPLNFVHEKIEEKKHLKKDRILPPATAFV